MKKLAVGVVAGGIAAAAIAMAAPAVASPEGPGSAEQTISALEDQGYRVIVNRVGDTPLSEASVVAIRPGTDVTGLAPDHDGDITQQVVYTTVYVDVK